ncbi:MAG: hypothetical protein ABI824_00820 [Acidobacteriota bacterium]
MKILFDQGTPAPIRNLVSLGMSAATLDDLLDSLSMCLDAESARRVVDLRVSELVQSRVAALAELANEGQLSGDERSEYEALVNAEDLISALQFKAQRHLTAIR